MEKRGYHVAEGKTVFTDAWADTVHSNRKMPYALKYAEKLGYPVIVKPNSKSQGSGVALVWNKKELISSLKEVFKDDKIAIIEKYLPGHDYRVVVLDKEIISAYERIPLSVIGDGKSSIFSLLKQKQKFFNSCGRDTKINFNDLRIKAKLKRQGFSFKDVPSKGQKIFLLDNANLSTGGDAIDVTSIIHPNFAKLAKNLTRDMGLRIAGVDIMVTKGDITKNPEICSHYIIEINSAPGLDHYATTGLAQQKKVEALYFKVLKALGKKD